MDKDMELRDIVNPASVVVVLQPNAIWVNVDGRCVLRVIRIEDLAVSLWDGCTLRPQLRKE